jgi:hypothetical protein
MLTLSNIVRVYQVAVSAFAGQGFGHFPEVVERTVKSRGQNRKKRPHCLSQSVRGSACVTILLSLLMLPCFPGVSDEESEPHHLQTTNISEHVLLRGCDGR